MTNVLQVYKRGFSSLLRKVTFDEHRAKKNSQDYWDELQQVQQPVRDSAALMWDQEQLQKDMNLTKSAEIPAKNPNWKENNGVHDFTSASLVPKFSYDSSGMTGATGPAIPWSSPVSASSVPAVSASSFSLVIPRPVKGMTGTTMGF